jgi:hypothetical protein
MCLHIIVENAKSAAETFIGGNIKQKVYKSMVCLEVCVSLQALEG